MRGFLYRLGVSLKDAGERAGHKRRRWIATVAIRLGLKLRDYAAGL